MAVVAVTSVALWASATVGKPERRPAPVAGQPTLETAQELARELTPQVAGRVERIRGLEFDRVPEPRLLTGEEFARIAARDARSGPRLERKIAEAESTARLLGLMTADEQLDILATGAPELAAAAWDTKRERLYVIYDAAGSEPALLEFLLAHELDHALEDQRFGLPEPMGVSDDGLLASLALIEGSATAVMVEYGSSYLNPLELAAASTGLDPGTDGVPRFFVQSLTWAYLRGAAFITALRTAGDGWERVDEALAENPPASTEQILHPRAYLGGEQPLEVRAEASALRTAGWEQVYRGVLGEYTTAQILRLGAPREVAALASAGWGGDEYVLLSDAGETDCESTCRAERALVIEWRWDSAADARVFARTLPAYLVGGLGARPRRGRVWSLDGGWVASSDDGATTRLAFAPDRELATASAGAGGGR